MPVSIPKHPSTQRSVYDELSSSTQASVVSHSPQVEEHFFPLHSAHGNALKHPGWRNIAAETMGSTLVRTTRGDPVIQLLERSRARAESTNLLPERIPAIQRYRECLHVTLRPHSKSRQLLSQSAKTTDFWPSK